MPLPLALAVLCLPALGEAGRADRDPAGELEGDSMSAMRTPGVAFVIVRHDPWCPMAYGEGARCAAGCRPKAEIVDGEHFVDTVRRDFRNRAQRRAAARAARRAS